MPDASSTVNEIRRSVEDRLARLALGLPAKAEDITFRALTDIWIKSKPHITQHTQASYYDCVAKFEAWAQGKGLTYVKHVRPRHGTEFLADLREAGIAANTQKRLFTVLHDYIKFAQAHNYHDHGPNPFAISIRVTPKPQEPYTDDEVARILAQPMPPTVKLAAQIAAYTGARLSSVLNLRWEHVNFDTQTIYWRHSKTTNYAEPMPDALADILRPLKSTGYVLPEDVVLKGHSWLSNAFIYYAGKSGVKGCKFHRFRHTYISKLAMAGVPVGIRQLLANHTSARMNEHYTHANASALLPHVKGLGFGALAAACHQQAVHVAQPAIVA